MTHTPTAIIYAYGDNTPDWGGISQQIQRCEAFAAHHDLRIREVVSEETWHGPALTRPAFRPLFAALTAMPEPPAYILVTTVDRVGRRMDLDEGSYIESRLRSAGVQLLVVDAERILSIMGKDIVPRPKTDVTAHLLRSLKPSLLQVYRQELEKQLILLDSRIQLYGHFLAHGGWPAVNPVDGTDGFGYRRFQCVAPGEYVTAPDDLPHGDGVLLPGPVDELHDVQRLCLMIWQYPNDSDPLVVQLHQRLGEDWSPTRAVAVIQDTTLSHIGIPGWALLSPAKQEMTVELLQEWLTEHDDD